MWDLVSEIPSERNPILIDLKAVNAMAVGKQQLAFDITRSIPVGSTPFGFVRVTIVRHHQDLLGSLPDFDADAEYDAANCGGFPQNPRVASCREKVAFHAVDVGRLEDAQREIVFRDSTADLETDPGQALIHRRIARTVEGYLAWKTGNTTDAFASLSEARRLDRFAVTARWIFAEVLVENFPAAAADLYLSIDDNLTWSPFSRLRAAEMFERMGDPERAAENYASALSAWGGADEGFGPKARAEAGLARVGG